MNLKNTKINNILISSTIFLFLLFLLMDCDNGIKVGPDFKIGFIYPNPVSVKDTLTISTEGAYGTGTLDFSDVIIRLYSGNNPIDTLKITGIYQTHNKIGKLKKDKNIEQIIQNSTLVIQCSFDGIKRGYYIIEVIVLHLKDKSDSKILIF